MEDIGAPQEAIALSPEQLSFAKAHLPESFVAFLDQCGYGGFLDMGSQVVDPQKFRPLAELIFKEDKQFSAANTHIVGYTTFGKLTLWSEEHWLTDVDLLSYEMNNLTVAPSKMPKTFVSETSALSPSKVDAS